jgi:hypothetical protein
MPPLPFTARCLFICAVVLPFASPSLKAQTEAAPAVVRIQIEPQIVVSPLAADFLGFGYETSAVAREGFFSPTNVHLVNLYRTLSPHGLVRIGGNVSDHAQFVSDGTPAARSEKDVTIINQAVLDDLGKFLRATGWKAMWGLNLATDSKTAAVREAQAVRAALGDRLQSFEIGNEVDLHPGAKHYTNYFAAYQEYKTAIRRALPDAVFSGPDVANNTQWAIDFAATEAKDMKLLTHHYYRTGAMRPDATIATLLAPDLAWEKTLQKLQAANARYGVPFRINEVNSFYGGGKAGVSDTFASALWCLDYLFLLAAHGGNGVNLETDVNQLGWVSHYSPIFRDATGQLIARPEYYGMLAFALAGNGDLIQLTASQTDINLRAYATKNADEVWVVLVNKDLARAANVEISLPENHSTAAIYRLTAPAITSRDQVTLGGAAVSPEGAWTPAETEKAVVKNGVAFLTVPSASAALVRLR